MDNAGFNICPNITSRVFSEQHLIMDSPLNIDMDNQGNFISYGVMVLN